MKKIQRLLLLEFWIPILVCLIVIVIYENDIVVAGSWTGDRLAEYYAAIAMELITIGTIPLALRLFKIKKIKKELGADALMALRRWGSVRMMLLTVPMMVNAWLYYQFMNVAFGYMGIIGLLCMVFVFPSKSRCGMETAPERKDEEKTEEDKQGQ